MTRFQLWNFTLWQRAECSLRVRGCGFISGFRLSTFWNQPRVFYFVNSEIFLKVITLWIHDNWNGKLKSLFFPKPPWQETGFILILSLYFPLQKNSRNKFFYPNWQAVNFTWLVYLTVLYQLHRSCSTQWCNYYVWRVGNNLYTVETDFMYTRSDCTGHSLSRK